MKQLEQAYLDTDYIVHIPDTKKKVVLRINEQPPKEWVNLLKEKNLKTYLFITAANPCSGLANKRENHERNLSLMNSLKESELYFYYGKATAKDRTWTEFSFCVFDVTEEYSRSLAFFYAQNAYLYGTASNFPELQWTLYDERIKRINQ